MIQAEPNYRPAQARAEAARCLQCFDPPCVVSCPAGIVIPRFIRMIRSGNLQGAAEVVRSANPLPRSCGLACPSEQLCASSCLRASIDQPIEIRRLHRFVTEAEDVAGVRQPKLAETKGRRVAIVGAGPAGLACAAELRRAGVEVTLFERRDRIGGVLSRTIPLYRFPQGTIESDAQWILGEDRRCEVRLSDDVQDLATLSASYDAVFVATGVATGMPAIPGTDLEGVLSADRFLEECREKAYRCPIGKQVVVVGGGNVAIDAALAVLQCGALAGHKPEVRIVYRRCRSLMPAWEREVEEAERLGVEFDFLLLPEKFEGKWGRLTGLCVHRARLGRSDADGRARPEPVEGSAMTIPCDTAILALGQKLDLAPLGSLPLTEGPFVQADPVTGQVEGKIFAGGDAAGGERIIVGAVRDGKQAARAILDSIGAARK